MPNSTTNASAYIPGVCNINREEIAKRRRAGYACLVTSLIGLFLALTVTQIRWWRVILVVPVFLTATCFLQAHHHFCVNYGSSGRQNAEPGSTQAHTVTSEAAIAKDRARVRVMNLQSLAIAIAVTAVILLLPVVQL